MDIFYDKENKKPTPAFWVVVVLLIILFLVLAVWRYLRLPTIGDAIANL